MNDRPLEYYAAHGYMTGPRDQADLFDRLAILTQCGNEAFDELRGLYATETRLPVPDAWAAAGGAWPPPVVEKNA